VDRLSTKTTIFRGLSIHVNKIFRGSSIHVKKIVRGSSLHVINNIPWIVYPRKQHIPWIVYPQKQHIPGIVYPRKKRGRNENFQKSPKIGELEGTINTPAEGTKITRKTKQPYQTKEVKKWDQEIMRHTS
jgi:hypothetical protein